MKIKQEWWEEDQKVQEKRTEQVINALNAGSIGADKDARGDAQHRYVDKSRTQIPDFFKPKRPKTVA